MIAPLPETASPRGVTALGDAMEVLADIDLLDMRARADVPSVVRQPSLRLHGGPKAPRAAALIRGTLPLRSRRRRRARLAEALGRRREVTRRPY